MKYFFILPLMLLGLAACSTKEEGTKTENYVVVGDAVPAFTTSEGGDYGVFSSPAGLKGQRTLLVLFYTPCKDCKKAMPLVHYVWENVREREGFQVIAISRQESNQTVSTYFAENGFTPMPYYLDANRDVFAKFANQTIPRLYIVDEEGTIEQMWVESLSLSKERLLQKLLGE